MYITIKMLKKKWNNGYKIVQGFLKINKKV